MSHLKERNAATGSMENTPKMGKPVVLTSVWSLGPAGSQAEWVPPRLAGRLDCVVLWMLFWFVLTEAHG